MYQTEPPALPFGKHKGQPLATVPSSYLQWALREVKLSSGLRAAVSEQLQARGVPVPPLPDPGPVPSCCGIQGLPHWQEDRLGRKRVRAQCRRCSRSLGFLPTMEPFTTMADAVASQTPILDVLTQLEALGVELVSDGRAVDFAGDGWRRVPPDLKATVHQCRHTLATMLGKTRRPA